MKTCFRQRLTGALGYPIDENPSPEMYEAGYKALGIPWRYQLMEVKPENLKAALEGIRALGFEGGESDHTPQDCSGGLYGPSVGKRKTHRCHKYGD